MKLMMCTFKSLDSLELYKIMKLRVDVFIVEQECHYEELDNKDQEAIHIYIKEQESIIAYLRVLAPGVSYKEASIGRVLVNKKYRGKGHGKEIMKMGIGYCKNNFFGNIKISAQSYLEKFYGNLGFEKKSEVYLEDNIPHIDMIYYN